MDDLESGYDDIQRSTSTGDLAAGYRKCPAFSHSLAGKASKRRSSRAWRRLLIPLYAFTLMRALAKKVDATPWGKAAFTPPAHNRRAQAR